MFLIDLMNFKGNDNCTKYGVGAIKIALELVSMEFRWHFFSSQTAANGKTRTKKKRFVSVAFVSSENFLLSDLIKFFLIQLLNASLILRVAWVSPFNYPVRCLLLQPFFVIFFPLKQHVKFVTIAHLCVCAIIAAIRSHAFHLVRGGTLTTLSLSSDALSIINPRKQMEQFRTFSEK